jgi:hypothetical protein
MHSAALASCEEIPLPSHASSSSIVAVTLAFFGRGLFMKRNVHSLVVGAAALAVAGGVVMAGGAAALAGGGGTPPWESSVSPAPNGFITFYNARGQVVTGGSITANGLAAYAVASSGDPSPTHTKATLYVKTPVDGENPGTWTGEEISASTNYPNVSAPAPVGTTTNPVETNSGTDTSLASYIAAYPNTDTSTTDGYAGLYDVRLEVSGGTGGSVTTYWDTVISVNSTAGTWSVDYPDYTADTTTTLSASPPSPEVTATPGAVTLNATVTPAEAGTVSFWNGSTQVGTTQPVTGTSGAASVSITPGDGSYSYTAVFSPTVGSSDIGSASAALPYVVSPPADVTSTALGDTVGTDGPTGTPVTFNATVTDTTNSANNPAVGTVSFYDNGSSIALGSPVSLAAGAASATYTIVGTSASTPESVVAVYTPTTGAAFATSTSSPVTFDVGLPTNPNATDTQTIEGTIPAGTLAVYTPYTPANPLDLGTLALNGTGTFFTGSAKLDANSADVATGSDPDSTFNGITVVDTTPGDLGWTVQALATNLSEVGGSSQISGENVGLTGLTAVIVPGEALTAGDVTLTNNAAASPPVASNDPGDQGLGGTAKTIAATNSSQTDGAIGINGTVTLNAPVSNPAGTYVGTITFTIAN